MESGLTSGLGSYPDHVSMLTLPRATTYTGTHAHITCTLHLQNYKHLKWRYNLEGSLDLTSQSQLTIMGVGDTSQDRLQSQLLQVHGGAHICSPSAPPWLP